MCRSGATWHVVQLISAWLDTALVRSFLTQYVVERESFDFDTLGASYRKVALWSADEARIRYVTAMHAGNPLNPVTVLP